MSRPADTAMNLLQRAEDLVRRRLRRTVPMEEATLRTMLEAPNATVGLTPEQQRALMDMQRHGVTA